MDVKVSILFLIGDKISNNFFHKIIFLDVGGKMPKSSLNIFGF
jgi:hypothetical protein